MTWLDEMFGTPKPVIGMVHFPALPGSPRYPAGSGLRVIEERVLHDVQALQNGGIDGLMFSNEDDRPYLTRYGPHVSSVMAAVVGRIRPEITIPFGVDVLWDPIATLALAKATGAGFVREVFTGAYAGDMGLWTTSAGETLRYRKSVDAEDVKLLFNLSAELAAPLATRPSAEQARSIVFSSLPDGLCVSGAGAGIPVAEDALAEAAGAVDIPVLANTGVRPDNASRLLAVADGAIVGTALKVGGHIWNQVDENRVRALMEVAVEHRLSAAT
ncbi:MAG: BtpA/SgcQ family protein [Chloroflexota bacterium]|nr:MAG: SgcQ protein [Chloroflexota bacterium]